MDLRGYYYSLPVPDRPAFAAKCGTSPAYIVHLINGERRMQPAMAMRIEIASGGAVLAEDACPDAPWREWLLSRVQRAAAVAQPAFEQGAALAPA